MTAFASETKLFRWVKTNADHGELQKEQTSNKYIKLVNTRVGKGLFKVKDSGGTSSGGSYKWYELVSDTFR